MARHIELNPVSHFTVNTVGPPGQRTFYVQGSKGSDTVSLIVEKQQAAMLASSLDSLLDELARRFPAGREAAQQVWTDLRLRQPLEDLFRAGRMELGYSEDLDRIVLVIYELVDEEVEEPNAVSFWMTREQAKTLIPHIEEVVQSGRPICGNCGQPIDPEGHFCPKRNGHQ